MMDSALSNAKAHYDKAKDVISLIESIDKIEAKDMLEVAREIFMPDNMTTLTFL